MIEKLIKLKKVKSDTVLMHRISRSVNSTCCWRNFKDNANPHSLYQ